jgi:hypothetical protein
VKANNRRDEVRRVFIERFPEQNRSGNDVLAFYGFLFENRPDLLPKPRRGDPYQFLKSDLSGLWAD